MCRYAVAPAHQYGLYFSASEPRAASTASSAFSVTWPTYATGPQLASSTTNATERMARIISPARPARAVAPEPDRDVDRRAEQREQRDHERPSEPDREQRHAV